VSCSSSRVETGFLRGSTTKFVCEFLKKNKLPGCRIAAFDLPNVVQEIHGLDPYFASEESIRLVGGLLPGLLRKYLETSAQAVDFAIVDGDHSYRGVLADLETLAPHMKSGGYIFAHDYRRRDPEYEGLTAAVDHFAAMRGFALLPLNTTELEGRQVWGSAPLRKPDQNELPLSSHLYYETLGRSHLAYEARSIVPVASIDGSGSDRPAKGQFDSLPRPHWTTALSCIGGASALVAVALPTKLVTLCAGRV
jgi:hypothetical protein